jgi:hypothetical protein
VIAASLLHGPTAPSIHSHHPSLPFWLRTPLTPSLHVARKQRGDNNKTHTLSLTCRPPRRRAAPANLPVRQALPDTVPILNSLSFQVACGARRETTKTTRHTPFDRRGQPIAQFAKNARTPNLTWIRCPSRSIGGFAKQQDTHLLTAEASRQQDTHLLTAEASRPPSSPNQRGRRTPPGFAVLPGRLAASRNNKTHSFWPTAFGRRPANPPVRQDRADAGPHLDSLSFQVACGTSREFNWSTCKSYKSSATENNTNKHKPHDTSFGTVKAKLVRRT